MDQTSNAILAALKDIAVAINKLSTIWRSLSTFTLTAAPSTTVSNASVRANSLIVLQAMNASAGTLQGTAAHLYVSNLVTGTGFTVTTANGSSAAGTEQFAYAVVNAV
jgi:hypothetical protein